MKSGKDMEIQMEERDDFISSVAETEAPCWEQVKRVLEEEANVLAFWLEGTRVDVLPHRVEIAVRRELKRLRRLAKWAESVGQEDRGLIGDEM